MFARSILRGGLCGVLGWVLVAGSSGPIVAQETPFLRGDSNIDGMVDVGDTIRLLDYFFADAEELGCHDAGDVNDDGALDIGDPILLLAHLFADTGPLPLPGDACGPDPTGDSLDCLSYPPCFVEDPRDVAGHVLRRVAYGPTPDLLDHVTDIGALAYVAEQLEPLTIDESDNDALNDLLATLQPSSDPADLYRLQYARGLYSRRQLLEQMTDFWNQHFSTSIQTVREHFVDLEDSQGDPIYTAQEAWQPATLHEWLETENFHILSLGDFEDLLYASATSVAMLIYLDNIFNVAGNANENYARELLELHTMGVDNGYTQTDVEVLARCFTGWTICRKAGADITDPHSGCLPDDDPFGFWAFHFDAPNHDYGAKTLFAGTPYELVLPAGDPVGDPDAGLDDGILAIQHLAGLQQTAEFISSKLIRKFVTDNEPPPAVLADCIATWLATGGDIQEVLEVILTSPEFLGPTYRWDKIETPMESVFSTIRALDGYTDGEVITEVLTALNQVPFNYLDPDGFPEVDGMGTAKLLERLNFNARLFRATDPAYDVVGLLMGRGVSLTDEEAIVDFFLDLLYQSEFTDLQRQLAITYLLTDDLGLPEPLDSSSPDYEVRIQKLAAFIASFPHASLQ